MKFQKLFFIIHVFATLFMTGVIWLIQVLNYPLFLKVETGFAAYHQSHMVRISFVVMPAMIIEMLTGLLLVFKPYPSFARKNFFLAFVCLIMVWISTFVLSVPAHNALVGSYDVQIVEKLIHTNWIRTIGWSVRSLLLGVIMFKVLDGNEKSIS